MGDFPCSVSCNEFDVFDAYCEKLFSSELAVLLFEECPSY